jgi:hypothetical protein
VNTLTKFSILVLNFNGRKLLDECLNHLEDMRYENKEIIVLDAGSTDGSRELVLEKHPYAKIVDLGGNLGYAEANNVGARYAEGEWLVFLNNDAFLKPNWLIEIERAINQDRLVTAVGGKIYKWSTHEFDSAGAYVDYPLGYGPARGRNRVDDGSYDEYGEVAYVSGAAMCVHRRKFLEVGGFDKSYKYLHEETDLCWRLRLRGYKVLYTPKAVCWHIGSYTFKRATLDRSYLVELNRMKTNMKNYAANHLVIWLFNELIYSVFLFGMAPVGEVYHQLVLAHSKAIAHFLRTLSGTMRSRADVQVTRIVSDDVILRLHRRRTIAEIAYDCIGGKN